MLFGLDDGEVLPPAPPVVHAAPPAVLVPVPARRPIPASRVFADFRDAREYMHTAGGAMKTAGGGRRYACIDDTCDAKCAVNACSGGFCLTWSRGQGHLVSCTALEQAPCHMQHSQLKMLADSCVNRPKDLQNKVPAMRPNTAIPLRTISNRILVMRKELLAQHQTVDSVIIAHLLRAANTGRQDVRVGSESWDIEDDTPLSIENSAGVCTVTTVAQMKLLQAVVDQGAKLHSAELSIDGTFSFTPAFSCYLALGVMAAKTFVPIFLSLSRAKSTKGYESAQHVGTMLRNAQRLMAGEHLDGLADFTGSVIADAGKGIRKSSQVKLNRRSVVKMLLKTRAASA